MPTDKRKALAMRVSYLLMACVSGAAWPASPAQQRNQLLSIGAVALAAFALYLAYRAWRKSQKQFELPPAKGAQKEHAGMGSSDLPSGPPDSTHSSPLASQPHKPNRPAGALEPTSGSEQSLASAKSLYERELYSEAETVLRKVIETDKRNSTAHFYLGLVYLKQQDKLAALARFTAAAAADPKNVDAIFWEAELLSDNPSQQKAALDCYYQVIELDPGHKNAQIRIHEMGGVLNGEASAVGGAPSPQDVYLDHEAPYLGDIYDVIRRYAKGEGVDSSDSFTKKDLLMSADTVRQVIDTRLRPRHPRMSVFLQQILLMLLAILLFTFLAPRHLSSKGGPMIYIGTLMVSVGYVVAYIFAKRRMTMQIDRGKIEVHGGHVFSNASLKSFLYAIESITPTQNFINMLTGDGTLKLVRGDKAIIKMPGLASFSELEEITNRLMALRTKMRSLQYLDKGIMG